MKQELVKSWMTNDVVTVDPDTAVPDAHKIMSDNTIRRLPVIKKGRLVGIITRGDVREAEPSDATTLSIWEINYLLSRLKIEKIMTRKPITISPDATIGQAARLMMDHKISGLPVVENGDKVVGIITESDIFRLIVEAWDNL